MRIQRQIAGKLGEIEKKDLSDRLHSIFQEYLDVSSVKSIFRDVIIESEYNPFEQKDKILKVDAKPRTRSRPNGLVDHLREQIDKVLEIHEGKEHLLQGGGRTTLPVGEWDTVDTTPVGFAARDYEQSLQPKDPKADLRGRVLRGKSEEVEAGLDHYDYPQGEEGARVARAEQPLGKRCFPEKAKEGGALLANSNEWSRNLSGLGAMQKEKKVEGQAPFASDTDILPAHCLPAVDPYW